MVSNGTLMKASKVVGDGDREFSLSPPEFVLVYDEKGDFYIGESLKPGMTQTHVRFPKADTTPLSPDEEARAQRLMNLLD